VAKCGLPDIANRRDFAVIPADGFNPERVKSLKDGIELTLGGKIRAAAIFDRDYRCAGEAKLIAHECRRFCDHVTVHERKEIENFLLVPAALDRAAARKVADRAKRVGKSMEYSSEVSQILDAFAAEKKSYVIAQCLAKTRAFERTNSPRLDDATVSESVLKELDSRWQDARLRLAMLSGKDALSAINQHLQDKYKISVTPSSIIDAMQTSEIPADMSELVYALAEFIRLEIVG
jgi:hypothetical protein